MDRRISVGLSYMYEQAFNQAILPLLEAGAVDALEWSFDTVSDHRLLPQWQQDLLGAYASEDRLYGHGVYYSLLNADWSEQQGAWLRKLQALQESFRFRHVSEHFGFMSSRNAHQGCPLPVPLTTETLRTGRQRLSALSSMVNCPVGVENLALAFSCEDVIGHGTFLRELIEPVGGFIVLDLHNLYCQSHNFHIPLRELITSYPLERVREIHVSGGSWAGREGSQAEIRRDTHDDAVPADVLAVLPFAVASCPNLDVVILERLGDTLSSEAEIREFQDQFVHIKNLVERTSVNRLVPEWPFSQKHRPELQNEVNGLLLRQQQDILKALSRSECAADAKSVLERNESLLNWKIGNWDTGMIDTAMQLGRKWGIDVST